jgi:sulfur-oxidizing protein SoxY
MNYVRRDVLRLIAGANACAIAGLEVSKAASPTGIDAQPLANFFSGAQPEESDAVVLDLPVFAESGSQVSVSVSANLPDVDSISILVEKNVQPLAAVLQISGPAAPYLQTQVHIEKSSNVIALVRMRNSDKLLIAKADVFVSSQDGCP